MTTQTDTEKPLAKAKFHLVGGKFIEMEFYNQKDVDYFSNEPGHDFDAKNIVLHSKLQHIIIPSKNVLFVEIEKVVHHGLPSK